MKLILSNDCILRLFVTFSFDCPFLDSCQIVVFFSLLWTQKWWIMVPNSPRMLHLLDEWRECNAQNSQRRGGGGQGFHNMFLCLTWLTVCRRFCRETIYCMKLCKFHMSCFLRCLTIMPFALTMQFTWYFHTFTLFVEPFKSLLWKPILYYTYWSWIEATYHPNIES